MDPTEAESEPPVHSTPPRGPESSPSSPPPAVTLLIENPGKGKNWGALLRCCAAFGIDTVFVVGFDRCDVRGSHGASKHVRLEAFVNHEQAVRALADAGFERLVGLMLSPPPPTGDGGAGGDEDDEDEDDFDSDRSVVRERFFYEPRNSEVEIVRMAANRCLDKPKATGTGAPGVTWNAQDYKSSPAHRLESVFPRNVCLVVDKIKRGLPWSLAKHCSSFVHVPHANFNLLGSMLTLEATVSIVLHEALTAGWVGYTAPAEGTRGGEKRHPTETANYEGQKYHVERIHKGDPQARERKRKEREDKLQELQDEQASAEPSSWMFLGNDSNDAGDY